MSVMTTLDRKAEKPMDAILNMFIGTKQWHIAADRPLQASDFVLTELGENEFADNVWSWKVAEGCPPIYDMGGEAFIDESKEGEIPKLRPAEREERATVQRGVVALFESYGGYIVVVDTDNEEDEMLSEYAASMLV